MRAVLSHITRRVVQQIRDRWRNLTPRWRQARRLAADPTSGVLQPWPETRVNRHPLFYAAIAERLAGRERPRLLSFGCATGEEVFAIADLLPDAHIDGVDINHACIADAQRQTPAVDAARIRFLAGDAPPEDGADYDAILCLSVLRHGHLDHAQPDDCSAILPFARAAALVDALDRRLVSGGLLLIWGNHFLFDDMPCASRYRCIAIPDRTAQPGPFYGRDNKRSPVTSNDRWLFEKLADAER